MKVRWGVVVAVAVLAAMPAAAQSVDEIIAKNVAAHGGMEKLKAVKSQRLTGRFLVQGLEAGAVIEQKRPNKFRLEITVQGMTMVQAYDGAAGWQIVPFQGKPDPEPLSADELKDAEEQGEFDGPLVDYKEKGNKVELMGKEDVEGASCYKLKVTRKDGDIRYIYIDSDSNLELKVEGKTTRNGQPVETETSFGNYKQIEGLMFPMSIESGQKGSPQKQKIVVDKIELNVAVDDARFVMPPPKPKPAETKPPVLPAHTAAAGQIH